MENQEHFNISIVLIMILMLTISISIAYSFYSEMDMSHYCTKKTDKKLYIKSFLNKNSLSVFQSYMHARGIDIIEGDSNQCLPQDVYDIASIIAHDIKCPLSMQEKQQLLLNFAYIYTKNKVIQYKLFDLMMGTGLLQMNSSILLDLVHNNYSILLPAILSWVRLAKTQKSMKVCGFKKTSEVLMQEALMGAVSSNNFHDFELLNSSGVRFTPHDSSKLLMHVVYEDKDPAFIPFLIKRGANIHYIGPDKNTVLTKAISNQNTIVVQALLECGDNFNQCVTHTKNRISHNFNQNCNKEIKALLDIYGQNI